MKRGEFITLLGGAAGTWPLTIRGQQAAKLPTVGYLGVVSPEQIKWTARSTTGDGRKTTRIAMAGRAGRRCARQSDVGTGVLFGWSLHQSA
jgi:hypothetical protein